MGHSDIITQNRNDSECKFSFESHVTGGDYCKAYPSILAKNKWRKAFGMAFREISLSFESGCEYDRNAIAVADLESGKKIGYIDRKTATQIALFQPIKILGKILDIENSVISSQIEIQSALSDNDAKMLYSDPNRYIVTLYPPFADFAFGRNPPTFSQFTYALDLGISPNKKTFKSISTAIDKAKKAHCRDKIYANIPSGHRHLLYSKMIDDSPADADQLREIRELHGCLLHPITCSEAEEIIEIIGNPDYVVLCPFCHKTVLNQPSCWSCGKSLKDLKIPIENYHRNTVE